MEDALVMSIAFSSSAAPVHLRKQGLGVKEHCPWEDVNAITK